MYKILGGRDGYTTFESIDIFVDIPFENFAVYQLLAKKHKLVFSISSLEAPQTVPLVEKSYRISFHLGGEESNKKEFMKDIERIEVFEDKINKFFGIIK